MTATIESVTYDVWAEERGTRRVCVVVSYSNRADAEIYGDALLRRIVSGRSKFMRVWVEQRLLRQRHGA